MENNQDYYFISTGEKSYFYTLNFSYLETVYNRDDAGNISESFVRINRFVRNLSHDYDVAINKAKEYHANKGGDNKLYLPKNEFQLNDRDSGIAEALRQALESKILPTGKYSGSHVSEVTNGYVHWVVANLYNANKCDTPVTILGHICYNHAVEKGWFDGWVKLGNEKLNDVEFESYINSVLSNDVMHVGKFSGSSLSEQVYTKKKTLNKSAVNYLKWFAEQKTHCDHMDIKPLIDCHGNKLNIVTNHDYYIYSFNAPKISDFELSIYVARKFLNDVCGTNYKTYTFKWDNVVIDDIDAAKIALKY